MVIETFEYLYKKKPLGGSLGGFMCTNWVMSPKHTLLEEGFEYRIFRGRSSYYARMGKRFVGICIPPEVEEDMGEGIRCKSFQGV